jgi:predicted MFS family arabinose efflux permease
VERDRPSWILPIIVFSQFAGSSVWFAGNAVLDDLRHALGLDAGAVGDLTSAVQLGFIAGTLTFAVFTISDRFSARKTFLACAVAAALANLGTCLADGLASLLVFRFLTGFFLAGIYPVGMKIAAGWYRDDLGAAIGWLVGALVLGTAFPHLVRALGYGFSWQSVMVAVSAVAAFGGLLMGLFVADGPYLTRASRFDPRALQTIFSSPSFRASVFGYLGHMWELYAFWAFVPFWLAARVQLGIDDGLDVSLWAFLVIAAGSIGCAGGGIVSLRAGSAPVAFAQLTSSGLCCLLSPLVFFAPLPFFLLFLLFWGITVVGDSPQFSTLNAQTAPRELVGSALTIANCLGFSITIASIQLLGYLSELVSPHYLLLPLVVGPVLGLYSLWPLLRAPQPVAG